LIDDATSWSWGRFVESDATPQNMAVLWEYLEKNGRMVDVYTDRHSMFTAAPRRGQSEQERVAADHVVKQLRLAKISTLEAANTFLENEYWPEWNERFWAASLGATLSILVRIGTFYFGPTNVPV
jgi:hypothetical protein